MSESAVELGRFEVREKRDDGSTRNFVAMAAVS